MIHNTSKLEVKKFEVKKFEVEEGLLTGILSTPDEDLYGDKTLPDAIELKSLVGTDVKAEHEPYATVGHVIDAYNEGNEKIVKCKLSQESKYYNDTVEKIKNGKYKGMSFGYETEKYSMKAGKRILEKVNVKEVTITANPANPKAKILELKSLNKFDNFPIAPLDTPWDVSKADMNIRKFLNSENAPNDEYRKCFLWFDKYALENFTSYKLQIVDAIDGELQIVPRAVKAAIGTGLNFMQYPEDMTAFETLRSLDLRIEKMMEDKKLELKSDLSKAQTTNQISKLWNFIDKASLNSNSMRESIFDAIERVCHANLTNKNNIEKKNSCPESGVHAKEGNSEAGLPNSGTPIPQPEEVSNALNGANAALDKKAFKQKQILQQMLNK